jgi:hypothetical protein
VLLMARFMEGMRMGAGVVGLGYGLYRLTRGSRDWVTTTALTTGISMMAAGMVGGRRRGMAQSINRLMGEMNWAMPQVGRQMNRMAPMGRKAMQMAPDMMDAARSALMRTLH